MTFRLAAAVAAVTFAATTGVTVMDVHRMAAHQSSAPLEPGQPLATSHAHQASGHDFGHHATSHADAPSSGHDAGHSGHSEHGPDDCNCVGPCASVVAPTLSEARFAEIWLGETAPIRLPVPTDRLIEQDPRSYLLPFPNAPPARV